MQRWLTLSFQVVLKLIAKKKVDLIFCTSGKEYVHPLVRSFRFFDLSPPSRPLFLIALCSLHLVVYNRYLTHKQLYLEIEDELLAAGGRLK